MTVNSAEPRLVVQNTTGTGPFAIPFTFSSGEVKVYKNGVLLSSGFTINVSAQTISMSSPLIVSDKLVVAHDPDVKQEITFPKLGLMSPLSLETCMDYLTKLVKVINSRAERIVRRSASSADGVLLLRPLQADRLIVPQSDGSLGFSNNAILEIDAMLQQIEAIPGGILSLSENPDIKAVAEFVASVVALATIASTVTSVAANTANINAVFALKGLIELTVANAQRITDLAAGTPIDGALTNFIWNGDLPYVHEYGLSGSSGVLAGAGNAAWSVGVGMRVWRATAPFEYTYVTRDGKSPYALRLKRKSAYTGEICVTYQVASDVVSQLKGQNLTLGCRVKTGSQFSGNITLRGRRNTTVQASPLQFTGVDASTSSVNSPATGGSFASSLFTDNVNSFTANEDRYVLLNFTHTSSATQIDAFEFIVTIPSVTWQNPDLSELDEWVELSDFFLVKGTWTSPPLYERGGDLEQRMIRRIATTTPFTGGGVGKRTLVSMVNSASCGDTDHLGRFLLTRANSAYTGGLSATGDDTSQETGARSSPVTGATGVVVRLDTGVDYTDGNGIAAANTHRAFTVGRWCVAGAYQLPAGTRVDYHMHLKGEF